MLFIGDLASLWWYCFVGSPRNDDFMVEIASSHLATVTLGLTVIANPANTMIELAKSQWRDEAIPGLEPIHSLVEQGDCFVVPPRNDDFMVEIASSHLATMTLGLTVIANPANTMIELAKSQWRDEAIPGLEPINSLVEQGDCFVVPPRNDASG